mmetsp:Transcript_20156/g.50159  ORF Transcript_20156/g.50159 Transcript_20156/m.50159 type:complete len:203 (-) Transcript_20156:387-995(-)
MHSHVSRNNNFLRMQTKSSESGHLFWKILLVLHQVGLSRQHRGGGFVILRNVDHREHSSRSKEPACLAENLFPSSEWNLVENVHDGNEIEGFFRKGCLFCIGLEEFCIRGGGGDWKFNPILVAMLRRTPMGFCELCNSFLFQVFGPSHGYHFGRGVNANNCDINIFLLSKCRSNGQCGHSNTTPKIENSYFAVLLDVGRSRL